jgi:hypothetical protein
MAQPNFFNQNAHRAYPFLRASVNQPDSGPLTLLNLPNDIVVDCGFLLGPHSAYDVATHIVYLDTLERLGDFFYFTFRSTAPELFTAPLVFTRHIDDEDYLTEHSDTGQDGISDSGSTGLSDCQEPLWSGFLVSGSMASLALLLPVDGTISRGTDGAIVEPALLHNMAGSIVTSLNLANDDRTRVAAPDDCDEIVAPYPTNVIHIRETCLQGELVLKPGYNASVQQNSTDNSIVLGAGVGLGAGEPCEEVPLFEGETSPDGGNLLSGGPQCNEVLRSINGKSDRLFQLLVSGGATITSFPDEHRIVINVNMSGMVLCFSEILNVSESV